MRRRSPAPISRSTAAGPRNRAGFRLSPHLRGEVASLPTHGWSSRRVPNVQNFYCVVTYPIKYPERVANNRDDSYSSPLFESRSRLRRTLNTFDDFDKSAFNGFGDRLTGVDRIVGGNSREVRQSPPGIDKLHTARNFAKAACTSSSLANSPASREAIAASIASNSSRVAT